jgi:copper oxidase (laccase) domain-containing protein
MTDADFPDLETFPALQALPGLVHGFVLRHPGIDVRTDRETALDRLRAHHQATARDRLDVAFADLRFGEQVHGDTVAVCDAAEGPKLWPGTDGLVTGTPGEFLGIYVADCCAVYLVDPVHRACGLVHSGKKGSELGIAARAVALMTEKYGSRPADLIVQLSPCIRPPAYEIDFAAQIRAACADAGVLASNIHDGGTCTSRNLEKYYSYRAESGKTGRMLAILGWRSQPPSDP